jgi:uncharacterized coiled-coil protein SlyX
MARPRVFVSSTFYDLKHIRASLEVFIESLGFDAILFEKGDIPFHPDQTLDDSCYREAANADIFVLIVGGRYGSAASTTTSHKQDPAEGYESITRKEFETAQQKEVPTFILVDAAVSAEYGTYLKNLNNKDINYAHVDSISVFRLLDSIFARPRNNPVFNFERATQIESWLREQWAGLFRELLQSRSQQRQLSALNAQVMELKSINDTLKNYMEAVIEKLNPTDSNQIIKTEEDKLKKAKLEILLRKNDFYRFASHIWRCSDSEIIDIIQKAKSFKEANGLFHSHGTKETKDGWANVSLNSPLARNDYNSARAVLGLEPLSLNEPNFEALADKPARRRVTKKDNDDS